MYVSMLYFRIVRVEGQFCNVQNNFFFVYLLLLFALQMQAKTNKLLISGHFWTVTLSFLLVVINGKENRVKATKM